MKLHLKPLSEQVVVITGASSGIGLTTARLAAERGARLVLASRSGYDLRELVAEILAAGHLAHAVQADVGREADVENIGREAKRVYGGIDTWVNNAGVSVYGRGLDVSTEDLRRVVDTNLWGVVHGSRVACRYLRRRGGALINMGSEVSDLAIPLQGIYSASKHAVKGWTDALRMELEDESAPISVTLIKPGAIDTPFTEHAKNYLEDAPTHVPPVYSPDAVAEAILYAATTPVRDLFVGGAAKFVSTLKRVTPRMTDRMLERTFIPGTHSGRPPYPRNALHEPGGGLRERGDYEGLVRDSLYTRAVIHPAVSAGVALGAGLAVMAVLAKREESTADVEAPPF